MAPLADMIKQSACLAISRCTATGREEITRELMEEIVLDYWGTLEYEELTGVRARKKQRRRRSEVAGSRVSRR